LPCWTFVTNSDDRIRVLQRVKARLATTGHVARVLVTESTSRSWSGLNEVTSGEHTAEEPSEG
jgi:hypothetical protein